MKRLFYVIVIIALPLIILFQYLNYRRFHPPADYEYPLNTNIDTAYYDQQAVVEYYEVASRVGNYARFCWAEHDIDVRFPDLDDPDAEARVQQYERYKAKAQLLEGKLLQSARWKTEYGYSNEEIRALQTGAQSQAEIEADRLLDNPVVAAKGDDNSLVYEIQRRLIEKGYHLPLDGLFRDSTELGVRLFQEANQLFSSGAVDKQTLTLLLTD